MEVNTKKKAKKTGKWKIFIIAGVLVLAAGVGGAYYYHTVQAANSESEDTIVLGEGQQLVYAKIISISGNEMTYSIAEAQTISMGAPGGDSDESSSFGAMSGKVESQTETTEEIPTEAPTEASTSSGNDKKNNSGGPGGKNGQKSSDRVDMSAFDTVSTSDDGTMTGYTVSEETQTILIPVGTDVITKLGNTTTFSRLANGDLIKMILETGADGTENIMKVYMVE